MTIAHESDHTIMAKMIVGGVFREDRGVTQASFDESSVVSDPELLCSMARGLALKAFEGLENVDVVCGWGLSGIVLASRVAQVLGSVFAYKKKVRCAFAERKEIKFTISPSGSVCIQDSWRFIPEGSELFLRNQIAVFVDGYEKTVGGQKVLIVSGCADKGNQIKSVVDLVGSCGGDPVAAAVICQDPDVDAEDLGVEHLFSLMTFLVEEATDPREEAESV